MYVRAVSENIYAMLKDKFRFLYKRTECQPNNIPYVIMTCIALHNIYISENDPWQPRRQLKGVEIFRKHVF